MQIFEKVFTRQQDAEIAAHYGEVLWSMGQQDKAREVWRKGHQSEPDNETLVETLKRLGVQL